MSGIRQLVGYPWVWVRIRCEEAELHRPGPSRYFNTRVQFYTDLTPSSGAYRLGADPMEVGHHETSDRVSKACGRLRVSGENSFYTSATCHDAGYLRYLAEASCRVGQRAGRGTQDRI